MAISKDLFLAVLSLDAYNQGYKAGINHGQTQIGSATFLTDKGDLEAQSHGFYGLAYTLNSAVGDLAAGTTIISYRGTDDIIGINAGNFFSSDMWNGYSLALGGTPGANQSELAIQFYQSVAGDGVDPRTANITLTGHSLGGGLAGLLGALYGREALIFDHMAFEGGANDNTMIARAAALDMCLGHC